MQILTESLSNSLRKSSKLLPRDFAELETLQTSIRPPYEFAKRSFFKTQEILQQELTKHNYPIISKHDVVKLTYNKFIVIEPIDCVTNFSKALPFFANVAFVVTRLEDGTLEATNLVIHFPALAEIYYAEKGSGAFMEKYNMSGNQPNPRLRVSGCRSLENALVTSNASKYLAAKNFDDNQIRSFGSLYYMMSCFAAGRFDALYLTGVSQLTLLSLELLARETGAIFLSDNETFIATNSSLMTEFQQLVI